MGSEFYLVVIPANNPEQALKDIFDALGCSPISEDEFGVMSEMEGIYPYFLYRVKKKNEDGMLRKDEWDDMWEDEEDEGE